MKLQTDGRRGRSTARGAEQSARRQPAAVHHKMDSPSAQEQAEARWAWRGLTSTEAEDRAQQRKRQNREGTTRRGGTGRHRQTHEDKPREEGDECTNYQLVFFVCCPSSRPPSSLAKGDAPERRHTTTQATRARRHTNAAHTKSEVRPKVARGVGRIVRVRVPGRGLLAAGQDFERSLSARRGQGQMESSSLMHRGA